MKKGLLTVVLIFWGLAAGAVTENVRVDYQLTVAGKKVPSSAFEMPFGEEKIIQFAPQRVKTNKGLKTVNYLKVHPVEGFSDDNSRILLKMELGYFSQNNSEVLSTPQVVAGNNKEAEISVGEKEEWFRLKVAPSVAR
ncbi:MAG: hypothetical protein KDD61_00365 [Bdellovibrionales bacterium]|nr:hypothetical protein [Bdellovibrionales bacterium]